MSEPLHQVLAINFVAVDVAQSKMEDSMPTDELSKRVYTFWKLLDGCDLLGNVCE